MASSVAEVRAAGIMIFRVLNRQIEYLLLRASNPGHWWTAPKGHVDPGEDELVTAKREVEEESGLRPEDYDIMDGFTSILRYQAWNKPKKVSYWAAKVKDPNVSIQISDEHDDYRWCSLSAVLSMTDKDDMKESYQLCENFLRKKLFDSNAAD